MNVLRAASFTGDDHWRAVADRALSAFGVSLAQSPMSHADMLLALDFRTDATREVVIVWPKHTDRTAAAPLIAVLQRTFLPNRVLAGAAEGEDLATLATLAPIVDGKRALNGQSTAYVCERGHCQLPTNDPAVLARELARQPAGALAR